MGFNFLNLQHTTHTTAHHGTRNSCENNFSKTKQQQRAMRKKCFHRARYKKPSQASRRLRQTTKTRSLKNVFFQLFIDKWDEHWSHSVANSSSSINVLIIIFTHLASFVCGNKSFLNADNNSFAERSVYMEI